MMARTTMCEKGERRYVIVDFDELPRVACPCGTARRAFADIAAFPATIHRTEISCDAKTHYHRKLTETYYFLECEPGAEMELDGQRVGVRPGMAIIIRPGVRHRAVGRMQVLIFVLPKFDPEDEWFD
jgi:mannose-6-phosphate isomerase-like protein (cupin superfamily)